MCLNFKFPGNGEVPAILGGTPSPKGSRDTVHQSSPTRLFPGNSLSADSYFVIMTTRGMDIQNESVKSTN